MKLSKSTVNQISYLGIFTLIAMSGNPLIIRASWNKFFYVLVAVICFLSFLTKPDYGFYKRYRSFFLCFSFIFLAQYMCFGWNTIMGIMGFFAKSFAGAYLIWVNGERFVYIYTRIMVFIAGVSIILFTLTITGFIEVPDLLHVRGVPDFSSIGIYIDSAALPKRNIGMFWEPGAFAGYILLVFLLNLGNIKQQIVQHKLAFLILFIALLTTFSTTGYILLFFMVVYVGFCASKSKILSTIFLVVPILLFSYHIYNQEDFLKEKIVGQYTHSIDMDGDYDPSRLGALLFDVHYIKKHLLIGNGLHERTRFADHPWLWGDNRPGHGNGFSNFWASMGLLGLLSWGVPVFKSLPFKKMDRMVFILLILLLLQGEQYLNFSLFLGLPLLNYGQNMIRK